MQHLYVTTAHKPTAVFHALTCSFTPRGSANEGSSQLNLVIAKSTHLEIYDVSEEGLTLRYETPIMGTIAIMKDFRPAGEQLDRLLIVTQRNQFAILGFDSGAGKIITHAKGNIKDPIGVSTDYGAFGSVDPLCRCVALHTYAGLAKLLALDMKGNIKNEQFDVRLDDGAVVDLAFLHGFDTPTLAVLYDTSDAPEGRSLRTHSVSLKDRELAPGPWTAISVDSGASFIIPVPEGGLLLCGEHSVSFVNAGEAAVSVALGCPITAHCLIEDEAVDSPKRWLLGDASGQVLVLALHGEGVPTALTIATVGMSSTAEAICFLTNGLCFVGSAFGNSQLLQLPDEEANNNQLTELQSFDNLGPIVDFAVIGVDGGDTSSGHQSQVVTCSGVGKDGSLRVVRSGVGYEELASLEMAGVKGVWSLKGLDTADGMADDDSGIGHDKYLVHSFIGETRVLGMVGEELEEIEVQDKFLAGETIFASNLLVGDSEVAVQVTAHGVVLLSQHDLSRVVSTAWVPESPITVVCAGSCHVVVALSGGVLLKLRVSPTDDGLFELTETGRMELDHEVSCMHLEEAPDQSVLVGVGMWTDLSVRLVWLEEWEQCLTVGLGGDTQARSVRLAKVGSPALTLFIGMGDGVLVSYGLVFPAQLEDLMDSAEVVNGQDKELSCRISLGNRRHLSLGSQPVLLTCFKNTSDYVSVFAACDRPTVIYAGESGRLLFNNVTVGSVSHMTSFNAAQFPDSLALVIKEPHSEERLVIGTLDSLQRLHVQTVSLDQQQPRRIAHMTKTKTIAVCTMDNAFPMATHSVRFFDACTFGSLASMELEPSEEVLAASAMSFEGDDDTEYLIVGTAFSTDETEFEPTSGRLLVLALRKHTDIAPASPASDGLAYAIEIVAERLMKGAVYDVAKLGGTRVAAGVGSRVQVFKWAQSSSSAAWKFDDDSSHNGQILALHIRCVDNMVVVGDLMRSVSVLQHDPCSSPVLKEVARDFHANWITALQPLSASFFLAAEHMNNLLTVCRKAPKLASEEAEERQVTSTESSRLEPCGEFHLGDMVNRFRCGSLGMSDHTNSKLPASSTTSSLQHELPPVIFGTVGGMLGSVVCLDVASYHLFSGLQRAVNKVVLRGSGVNAAVGGLNHALFRSFENERRTGEWKGFIDGDLVEMFLDIDRDEMMAIVKLLIEDGWIAPDFVSPEKKAPHDPDQVLAVLLQKIEDMSRRH